MNKGKIVDDTSNIVPQVNVNYFSKFRYYSVLSPKISIRAFFIINIMRMKHIQLCLHYMQTVIHVTLVRHKLDQKLEVSA